MGVGADHRHTGQRLHDQLLDGRRHVAAAGRRGASHEAAGRLADWLIRNGLPARGQLGKVGNDPQRSRPHGSRPYPGRNWASQAKERNSPKTQKLKWERLT